MIAVHLPFLALMGLTVAGVVGSIWYSNRRAYARAAEQRRLRRSFDNA